MSCILIWPKLSTAVTKTDIFVEKTGQLYRFLGISVYSYSLNVIISGASRRLSRARRKENASKRMV